MMSNYAASLVIRESNLHALPYAMPWKRRCASIHASLHADQLLLHVGLLALHGNWQFLSEHESLSPCAFELHPTAGPYPKSIRLMVNVHSNS